MTAMTQDEPRHGPPNGDEMRDAVRRRAERRARGQKEGGPSVWRNLSMIGGLGSLIVVPTLIGVAIGRWLDHVFGHEHTFTVTMLVLGIITGCYLAWKRITER